MGYSWEESVVDIRSGIQLYEDAYFEILKNDFELLTWLLHTASDVYDSAPSNVLARFDYSHQEVEGAVQHWQDVSVRRVLRRLGVWFQGDHAVEIRGHASEGYRLNPGKLPFHRPELIVSPRQYGWWDKNSIEDFSVSNVAIQVPFSLFQNYLLQHQPDQNTCEAIVVAKDPRLLSTMIRYALVGKPRVWLFMARAISLMGGRETIFDQFICGLPFSSASIITKCWNLICRKNSPEILEIIDKILYSEPSVRLKAFEDLHSLEEDVRHLLLEVVVDDPSRNLRRRAKQALTL